jgi:hypothetical protein
MGIIYRLKAETGAEISYCIKEWNKSNFDYDSAKSELLLIGKILRLRVQSDFGMLDCKKALEQNDWDHNKALKYLVDHHNPLGIFF